MKNLGEFELRLINYRKDITEKEFVRKHYGFHDITIVLSGRIILETKQQTYTINPGDALYIPPNDYNKRYFEGDISYFSVNFIFNERNDDFRLGTHLLSVLSPEILEYINMVKRMLKKESVGTEYNEKLYLFSRLILLSIMETNVEVTTPAVEKAKKFINNNYQQKITLEDVAAYVHLHSSYLGTIFKRDVGCTVIEYLNRVRVDHAKLLLLNTKQPISKIGTLCGIADPRYFCRVFKKIADYTPHTWRKINTQNRKTQYMNPKEKEHLDELYINSSGKDEN